MARRLNRSRIYRQKPDRSNRFPVMAASLIASVRGLRIFCGSYSSVLGCRGVQTRAPRTPFSEDEYDAESDSESIRNEEDAIKSALKRRQKSILWKRMKREMEPLGPPERRLTWNAIEQIKYLKQELPEEWTVSRLAEGFNVSTDTIKRVLKSKFTPSESRKMKQDATVFRRLQLISAGSNNDQPLLIPSAKGSAQRLLPCQENEKTMLVSQSNSPLPSKTSDTSPVALWSEDAQRNKSQLLVRTQESQGTLPVISTAPNVTLTTKAEVVHAQSTPDSEIQVWLTEKWDGEVLSDNELEELANSRLQNNMKVVQKGREFFDSDGNFLYRI